MIRHFYRLLTPALLLAATPLVAQAPDQTRPIETANLDTTCAACQDFFQFANGGWIKQAKIPGDQPAWGSFEELYERNLGQLHAMLDDAAQHPQPGAKWQKLGDFYGACMDTVTVERLGAAPIQPELDRIATIKDRRSLQAAVAQLHREAIGVGFELGAAQDAKKSDRVIAIARQGGLGLPDRDYYTKTDSASAAIREQYVGHVATMLRLAGDDSVAAARSAKAVVQLETALANASMTRVQRRNPDSTYHLFTLADFQRSTPSFNWASYLGGRGLAGVREVNVEQPKFFVTVDSLVAKTPLDVWRAYLRWQTVHSAAPLLSSAFDKENFRFFSGVLQGVTEQRPRWKRCVDATDGSIGEILGEAYVDKHFPPEAKARALEMVKNIRTELHTRLGELSWMSDATKQKAYVKLDAIVQKIGYPDRWRDYSTLVVLPAEYAANTRRATVFEVRRVMNKIGRPVDRTEWGMTPPTVNAYYSGQMNEIVFPAGILQPPFFDFKADDAVNYGGMGAVIGHEISHGFDDEGRKYDAKGNLSGWWTDQDASEFERRADVVVDQYGNYVAIDSLKLNGRLTLGENIADFAGLTIAYGAYKRSLQGKPTPAPIDGFTGDQRFFLAWAQIWREVRRPEFSKLLVNVDPHSPGKYRTNGPLANMPEFAKAWGCKTGDPMMRGEQQRAQIW
jgi:putative endopeptidase